MLALLSLGERIVLVAVLIIGVIVTIGWGD